MARLPPKICLPACQSNESPWLTYVLTIKFINKKQYLKFENQSLDIPTALLVTQRGYNFFFYCQCNLSQKRQNSGDLTRRTSFKSLAQVTSLVFIQYFVPSFSSINPFWKEPEPILFGRTNVAECVVINGLTWFKASIPEEIFFEKFSVFVGPGEGLVNC